MTSDEYPYWDRDEWYETDDEFVSKRLLMDLRKKYEERLAEKKDYPYDEEWDPSV
jgi:hypothetical protein